MDKRPWLPALTPAPPETDMSRKDRRALEADIKYWRDSSKRKDKEITLLESKIKGLKGHITRLQGQLSRKGVYKS